MEKIIYRLVQWPWLAALVVFLILVQLPLGPWYLSAWFVLGASLFAMILARNTKIRVGRSILAKTRRHPRVGPSAPIEAPILP